MHKIGQAPESAGSLSACRLVSMASQVELEDQQLQDLSPLMGTCTMATIDHLLLQYQ